MSNIKENKRERIKRVWLSVCDMKPINRERLKRAHFVKGVACCTLTSVTATLIQYPSQRPTLSLFLSLHGRQWICTHSGRARELWRLLKFSRPGHRLKFLAGLLRWRHLSREIWRPAWCDRRWMYGPRTARPHYISLFYAFHKADLCAIDFLIYSWLVIFAAGRALFADAARAARPNEWL